MITIRAAAGGLTPLACAALVATLAAPASAAGLSARELELHRFDPPSMLAAHQAHVAAMSQPGVSAMDTTPPTVTAFSVAPTANVSSVPGGVTISLTASDGDSGISYAFALLAGPSGQTVWAPLYSAMPMRNLKVKAQQAMSAYAEPGDWSVSGVSLQDYAGNWTDLDGPALAALGNTRFTVTSRGLGDVVAPALISGKVVNATISASGKQRHTNMEPWTGVTLVGRDDGASLSGLNYASAWFCTLDRLSCFSVAGTSTAVATSQSLTIGASVQIGLGAMPGEYHLDAVYLGDRAGNWTNYTSTEFGGTTDFSTFFTGGTTITITP